MQGSLENKRIDYLLFRLQKVDDMLVGDLKNVDLRDVSKNLTVKGNLLLGSGGHDEGCQVGQAR